MPQMRETITTCKPTDELPFDLAVSLWRSADEELREGEPDWVERAGGFSIEGPGVRMYSGLLRKASPTEFLTQRVSLFRLYYHPGDMQVVEEAEEHAVFASSASMVPIRCSVVVRPVVFVAH